MRDPRPIAHETRFRRKTRGEKLLGASPGTIPQGLVYIPGALTTEEAEWFMTCIDMDSVPWTNAPGSRKVKQYGYRYNYETRTVDKKADYLGPFPEWLIALASLIKIANIIPDDFFFNQCIVNRYLPGEGITPHSDSRVFGDHIVSISLGSQASMLFQTPQGDKKEVLLHKNSLLCMSGDARYKWTHTIPARKTDPIPGTTTRSTRDTRVSITFRYVK